MATSETSAVEMNCDKDMVLRMSRTVGRISCSSRGPLRNRGQTSSVSMATRPLSPPARISDTEPTLARGTADLSSAKAASIDKHTPPWSVNAVRSTVEVKVMVGGTQLFMTMRCHRQLWGVPYQRKYRKPRAAATTTALRAKVRMAMGPVLVQGEGGDAGGKGSRDASGGTAVA
jgi:hypothetical protein